MIGSVLRDHRIVTELGSGGMGTVYYAEHRVIGRRAAIKVLNADIASSEEIVGRFFAEARAVNAIRHPNIVDITDFGCEQGRYFIVMEFLEGETIGARLERIRCFEESQALGLLAQVCSALAAVHDQGIVHRDLKTENIFITNHRDYPDFVKVLDFGVVKVAGSALESRPGLVIGTPSYMSPEQCVGDATLDSRSDIYSLGVVAYQMLTRQLPFAGSAMEQMHGHLTVVPPEPRALNPKISEPMEAIIMRALAKRPADRFETVAQLREHLRGVQTGRPLPVPAQSQRKQPAAPAVAPALAEAPATADQAEIERCQSVHLAGKLHQIIGRRLAQNTLKLPALPAVALKCLELLRDPSTSFAAVASTLELDPLISARIMRLVNSPAYGGCSRIPSIEAAVNRLGIKPLRAVLQELSAQEVFTSRNPRIRTAFKGIWEHCLAVAQLARALATALPKAVDPESAFLAGLFHDIGKPIVAVVLLEAERTLLGDDEWVSEAAWLMTINACHRQVGAALASSWSLPHEVISAIRGLETYELRAGASCTNLVRFANALTKREGLYAGAVDADETFGAVHQGRRLLGVNEALEETLIAGMKLQLEGVTRLEEASTSPGRAVGV